ncbi:Uncharacterized protein FKW44_016746, partial [Caligus rogercresseyi]
AGIIRTSSLSWTTPLHFVKKKQPVEWGMVGDYHSKKIPDKYPLPHMKDIATRLHVSRIFSKVDLCQHTTTSLLTKKQTQNGIYKSIR